MKVSLLHFSPTGGTKKVLDILGEALQYSTVEIDLCDTNIDFSQYQFDENDICIVAVPAFGGRAPEIALSHLLQMDGGSAKTILVAVYGNRAYEDTLLELKNTLKQRKFNCIAAVSAIAEHSIMHQYAIGRPDTQDKAELYKIAEQLKIAIDKAAPIKEVEVPGNFPYKEYHGVPFRPHASKACIKCGLCAEKCPANAIPKSEPSSIDEAICISCMRCISVCPTRARQIDQTMVAVIAEKMKDVCTQRKSNQLFMNLYRI